VLDEFIDTLMEEPGSTDLCKMKIDVGTARLICQRHYKIPDRLKDGVREEIERLVDSGIIVESTSPWSSPIVPC